METSGGQKEAVYRSRFLARIFKSDRTRTTKIPFLKGRPAAGRLVLHPKRSNASYTYLCTTPTLRANSQWRIFVISFDAFEHESLLLRQLENQNQVRKKVNAGDESNEMSNRVVCIITSLHVHTQPVFLTDAFVSKRFHYALPEPHNYEKDGQSLITQKADASSFLLLSSLSNQVCSNVFLHDPLRILASFAPTYRHR